MSLNIYFKDVDALPNLPVAKDAEVVFKKFRLDGCDYDKEIIQSVERGKYLDHIMFEDRFGVRLYVSCMSTGSKIALSLYHCDGLIINGAELGYNALGDAIKFCNRGNLLLPAGKYFIEGEIEDFEIDVVCRGRHYTSLNEFADYLMECAPYD